jgi:hypothetical protein
MKISSEVKLPQSCCTSHFHGDACVDFEIDFGLARKGLSEVPIHDASLENVLSDPLTL